MQIKRRFDKESVIKMLKGALIAATGAACLYILAIVGALEVEDPLLASLIAWAVPTITNVIKEWVRGA